MNYLKRFCPNYIVLVMISAAAVSCVPPKLPLVQVVPPKPSVKVSQNETSKNGSIDIYYVNHVTNVVQDGALRRMDAEPFVELNNLADLTAYKQEIEFLLKRIEEAEAKMKVHEDEIPTTAEQETDQP